MSYVCETTSGEQVYPCAVRFLEMLLRGAFGEGVHVVLLSGSLGSGKTTFVQALARALRIDEHVDSPTFLIMQEYPLSSFGSDRSWETLVHVDAYRASNERELRSIGMGEVLQNERALIVVEWGEYVQSFCESLHIPFVQLIFTVQNGTYVIEQCPAVSLPPSVT